MRLHCSSLAQIAAFNSSRFAVGITTILRFFPPSKTYLVFTIPRSRIAERPCSRRACPVLAAPPEQ